VLIVAALLSPEATASWAWPAIYLGVITLVAEFGLGIAVLACVS